MTTKLSAAGRRDRKRIRKLVKKWEPRFALGHLDIHHAFIPDYMQGDDEHWTSADTESDWHYRSARIRWYLPSVARLGDKDLESVVVHEYVHILLGPLKNRLKKDSEEQDELSTENVARAILGTAKALR